MTHYRETLLEPPVAQKPESVNCDWQRWSTIVAQIEQNDPNGMADLYAELSQTYPYYFLNHVGADVAEDATHNLFLMTVSQVRAGRLRDPARLMGFVRTIAHRTKCWEITVRLKSREKELSTNQLPRLLDRRKLVDESVADDERRQILHECLAEMSACDRELLERFYLQEQTREQIQRDMGLSYDQFRLWKSRAKTRLGELGRRKLKPSRSISATVRPRIQARGSELWTSST